jgi:hypothetical protein
VNRTNVIQRIIDKKNAQTYLEIGIFDGDNFFQIKARHKIAVDPNIKFSRKRRVKWIIKNFYNLTAKYYESTSDQFFAQINQKDKFDVIFIDGLHTYEQALRDVSNSLINLRENGIIVLHDCNPPNRAAAHPAMSFKHAADMKLTGWTEEWCGDVWKTVCYLRSQKKDLKVFVLDCDYGLGIVMKGNPDTCLSLSEDVLAKMTYENLANDKINLLNLKCESYFIEFLKTI